MEMKYFITIGLLLLSQAILAGSAATKVLMHVENQVSVVEDKKTNQEITIRRDLILTVPNQMLIIQTPHNSITKSSGKKGEVKSIGNNKIDIFF